MKSTVFYAGDFGLFSDERDCVAVVTHGDFRYRIYFNVMMRTYLIKVNGSVYDASNQGGQ